MLCKFCNSKDNTAKDLFCKSCGKIIDKTHLNAFETFDLTETFTIDLAQTKATFISLQSSYHPDRFVGKDDEQELSISNSTHINKCFKILRNPITRAEHLLDIKGIKTIGERVTDMEFLSKSFDWRERMMDEDEVDSLESEVLGEYNEYLIAFATAHQKRNYKVAKDSYLKLKFYKRFLDEIDDSKI